MILICGTGRSGTLTWTHYLKAQGLIARHEPHSERLLELAPLSMHGADPIVGLSWLRWPEASAHHLYACVWDALDRLFTPTWIWVRRDRYEAVASMVGKGWYGKDAGGWGKRPTAVDAGELDEDTWKGLPQVAKCAWWVGWATRQLSQLPADRTVHAQLEGDHLEPLRQLGLHRPVSRMPLNVSQHRSLTVEEKRWVDRALP